MIEKIGFIAAIVLPLWNIPLILRIIERKSSRDISLPWALGVWTCLALMTPVGIQSSEMVWRVFSIMNVSIFSFVVIIVLWYRKR